MMIITVLLADDHQMVRDGLRALLDKAGGFRVVASVADGQQAVQEAHRLQPNVAVMDIAMPGLNGIDAAGQIRAELPGTQVVILSMYATTEHVYRALSAGALGYLLKESAGIELAMAVRAANAGRRYVTPRIAEMLVDSLRLSLSRERKLSPVESLSRREREVLQMVAEGLTSAQIGERLSLSRRTVETYRLRLMRKLELEDLPALVRYAIENGLIPRGQG